MKTRSPFIVCVFLFIAAASCKKENNASNPGSSNTHLVRIQQGTDPDLNNDTVYIISYGDSNRIASVADSINQDTLIAAYNNSGRLSTVTETYGTNASYTYDGNGQLQQVDYNMGGSHEQFVFEYTNGVVSKKTYNSNLGSGPVSLQGYFTYTFSGGNITDIKEYTSASTLVAETTCTYGTQANAFKSLSLLNYGNLLGTDEIISLETYFNTNNLTGFTINNSIPTSSVYTFDNNQLPSKIVTTDNMNSGVFTWFFSYK